jgi:hypothetical protein
LNTLAVGPVAEDIANAAAMASPSMKPTRHQVEEGVGTVLGVCNEGVFVALPFGFYKGGFLKGRFVQRSHALRYRRHQLSLHGPGRTLLWMAGRINALVQPDIGIS